MTDRYDIDFIESASDGCFGVGSTKGVREIHEHVPDVGHLSAVGDRVYYDVYQTGLNGKVIRLRFYDVIRAHARSLLEPDIADD